MAIRFLFFLISKVENFVPPVETVGAVKVVFALICCLLVVYVEKAILFMMK